MIDNRIMPPPLPPLPPAPVLSYEMAAPPPPVWLARLICGLAIGYGTVAAGYAAASRIPGANASRAWSDLPVAVSGLILMVFGLLGIFRVSGSRLGIVVSAVLLMLCSWLAQLATLRLYGSPDISVIAFNLVNFVDNAVVPIFLVLCLVREPIKGYFTSGRGSEKGHS